MNQRHGSIKGLIVRLFHRRQQRDQERDREALGYSTAIMTSDSSEWRSLLGKEVEDPSYHSSFWHRFLADEKYGSVDYSVLAVAVMTLGLIMIVEVCRHRLDHAALGRPFFKAVLEGVYTECKLQYAV